MLFEKRIRKIFTLSDVHDLKNVLALTTETPMDSSVNDNATERNRRTMQVYRKREIGIC